MPYNDADVGRLVMDYRGGYSLHNEDDIPWYVWPILLGVLITIGAIVLPWIANILMFLGRTWVKYDAWVGSLFGG